MSLHPVLRSPSAALLALLFASPASAAEAFRAPQSFADVGAGFWVLSALVVLALLGFLIWVLYRRPVDPEQHASTGKYHAAGALVIAISLFTLLLYVIVAARVQEVPATDRAWDWQPGETLTDPGGSDLEGEPYRGYQIYLAEGCVYCHTQYVRKEDIPTGWVTAGDESDVSKPGDFVNYPFTLLGTQRNGPDLSLIGRQIADMQYHIDHLERPRDFKPRSIMPSYAHLPQEDLKDLAAYMVSLGNPPAELKAGETKAAAEGDGDDGEADSQVARGRQLFRAQGCVGCHSLDGSKNVGPTMQGLWGHEVKLESGETLTADADYIRESIVDPGASIVAGYPDVMPDRFSELSDDEIEALIALIRAQGEGDS